MDDLISRQAAIDALNEKKVYRPLDSDRWVISDCINAIVNLPSAQPEIVRCRNCGFWDRDTLRHQYNDFRNWNEAECKILADRDGWNEINRYTEADDYCSYAERKIDG